MNGYLIVICIILIMFAGLAIFIVQGDADERRFLSEHENDESLIPADADVESVDDELPDPPSTNTDVESSSSQSPADSNETAKAPQV